MFDECRGRYNVAMFLHLSCAKHDLSNVVKRLVDWQKLNRPVGKYCFYKVCDVLETARWTANALSATSKKWYTQFHKFENVMAEVLGSVDEAKGAVQMLRSLSHCKSTRLLNQLLNVDKLFSL